MNSTADQPLLPESLPAEIALNDIGLRLVLAQLPTVLWTVDLDLQFLSISGAGLREQAVAVSSGAKRSLIEELSADPLQAERIAAHRRALQGEAVSYDDTFGSRHYHSRLEPLRDADGKIIGAIGVAHDITERVEAERALQAAKEELEDRVAQRTRQLENANAKLSAEIVQRAQAVEEAHEQYNLLLKLLDLHERERRLIAYEIHDGLVQDITGALMRLEGMQARLDQNSQENSELETLVGGMRKAVREARNLIRGLQPPLLDEAGLLPALQHLIEQHQAATGMESTFSSKGDFDQLAVPIQSALYRITQESLTNARRHSDADSVSVSLTRSGERVRLVIEDTGVGFDPSSVKENHFGLQGIRERARLLRGRATISSLPGSGSRIEVELPLVPPGPGLP